MGKYLEFRRFFWFRSSLLGRVLKVLDVICIFFFLRFWLFCGWGDLGLFIGVFMEFFVEVFVFVRNLF